MAESTSKNNKSFDISLFAKGAAMGIAEVIPGVSGGTIAFIAGIYQELINTIKAFNIDAVKLVLSGRFVGFFNHINGVFLLQLLIGMGGGVLIGIFGVTHMIENYPEILWSFFFGLIVASIPLMWATIKSKNYYLILFFILSAAIAYWITSITPVSGSENPLYLFFAGMIAIVALVLPGVSGSFILLILGVYGLVIPTLKSFLEGPNSDDFKIIVVFALGCLLGLLVFVRIISKAFDNFHDQTIAIMCGFMLGSLNKIWPWRTPNSILLKENNQVIKDPLIYLKENPLSSEEYKIVTEENVLPQFYHSEPYLLGSILALFLGISIIFAIKKWQNQ